ncbi:MULTISPECIES: amino acid ABC transporter permease [unclassified Solwaraspora]|uniref:amino acid ABC transporter permease n=1 Tax=unclassified Solwaraspora TaxID=2627926 RepID=UPI00259B0073|nr:amino acid ABC transporter permease [Solwaraspora sp. WMMA2056]WJK39871.1 amino acid ABC transporter permease [Solwaraspora sp. WMMA2056]
MRVLVDHFDVFVGGFWLTLQLCVLSATGALLIGTFIAILRISPVPPLRWLGGAYVTVFRNVPLTIVMFFSAFGLPALGSNADFLRIPGLSTIFSRLGIDLPYFRFAVIALSVYTGAFVCEALRSGINAVPPGQAEAARAIGLTFTQNLRHVVLPQAWKAAIVPLGSVIIAMIKNSALAGFFGVVGDLSNSAQNLTSALGEPIIPVFVGISIGFLIMTVPLGMLLDRVEARRAVAR